MNLPEIPSSGLSSESSGVATPPSSLFWPARWDGKIHCGVYSSANPAESLRIINAVFDGAVGPATNIVAVNAGAAIYVAGICDSIKSGFSIALDAIQTGKAKKTFNDFILFTKTVRE